MRTRLSSMPAYVSTSGVLIRARFEPTLVIVDSQISDQERPTETFSCAIVAQQHTRILDDGVPNIIIKHRRKARSP